MAEREKEGQCQGTPSEKSSDLFFQAGQILALSPIPAP